MATIERDESRDITGATAFKVTSPVRLDQLCFEVAERMGWVMPANISVDGSPSQASDQSPCTLYVESQGVSVQTFIEVVEDHEPDANWGAPAEYTEAVFAEVKQRALDGEQLGEDDIQVALAGLLRRSDD